MIQNEDLNDIGLEVAKLKHYDIINVHNFNIMAGYASQFRTFPYHPLYGVAMNLHAVYTKVISKEK